MTRTSPIIGSCPNRYSESYAAWSHLSAAKMLNETYEVPTPGDPSCAGFTAPDDFVGFTPISQSSPTGDPFIYRFSLSGLSYGGNTFFRSLRISYPAEVIWSLDSKLDDGIIDGDFGTRSGTVLSDSFENLGTVCAPDNTPPDEICDFRIFFSKTLEEPIL